MNIEDEIQRPLSGEEMKQTAINMGLNVKIILYNNLYKYNTIDELFISCKNIIILYRWADKMGHWVALFKSGDYIEFFEPYGTPPDALKKQINKSFLKTSGQQPDYIKKLLLTYDNKNINYNNYKLQKKGDINTCGRHCLVRLMFSDYNIDEYKKIFKKINPDLYVVLFTSHFK